MDVLAREAFWLACGLVAYVYVGYPALLFLLRTIRRQTTVSSDTADPSVTVIIPARNEEALIRQKLENTLAIDYPGERMEVIVASDGSTDRTNDIVAGYGARGVRLLPLPRNVGKSAAQIRAAGEAGGDLLLFTDADVMLRPDAVRRLVGRFADGRVGCAVARIAYRNTGASAVSEGESAYWRYELTLRAWESDVGNLAMGSGLLAVRRDLVSLARPEWGDVDFVVPLQVVLAGFRVVFEPAAVGDTDLYQVTPRAMLQTRIRTITEDLWGLLACRKVLNPLRHPLHSWALVSHKLLRWLVPYFLLVTFWASVALRRDPVFQATLALQVAFYAAAAVGYGVSRSRRRTPLVGLPFAFCLVNTAALVGVLQVAAGRRSRTWEPIRW